MGWLTPDILSRRGGRTITTNVRTQRLVGSHPLSMQTPTAGLARLRSLTAPLTRPHSQPQIRHERRTDSQIKRLESGGSGQQASMWTSTFCSICSTATVKRPVNISLVTTGAGALSSKKSKIWAIQTMSAIKDRYVLDCEANPV